MYNAVSVLSKDASAFSTSENRHKTRKLMTSCVTVVVNFLTLTSIQLNGPDNVIKAIYLFTEN